MITPEGARHTALMDVILLGPLGDWALPKFVEGYGNVLIVENSNFER